MSPVNPPHISSQDTHFTTPDHKSVTAVLNSSCDTKSY